MTTIKQTDRDVAAEMFYYMDGTPERSDAIRAGLRDDMDYVQAFARHRERARYTAENGLFASLEAGKHASYSELFAALEAATAREAALVAQVEALTAENERLRGLLDAWLGLAREHLDTEVAGRTFAALARKGEQ